jgi:hypothetical protein
LTKYGDNLKIFIKNSILRECEDTKTQIIIFKSSAVQYFYALDFFFEVKAIFLAVVNVINPSKTN